MFFRFLLGRFLKLFELRVKLGCGVGVWVLGRIGGEFGNVCVFERRFGRFELFNRYLIGFLVKEIV